MLTRLLLLGALVLGTVAPLAAGPGDHCRRHGSMDEMTQMQDHPTSDIPERPRPTHQGRDHCPPAACVVATHCSWGTILTDIMVTPVAARPDSPHLAFRTSHHL